MKFELNLDRLSDVVIYPFFECNLKCLGCPVKKPKSREIGFMKSDPDDFSLHIEPDHLERISSWNVKNIVILGGEPFLSSYFVEMLKILDGRPKTIVYTNATLIYDYIEKEGYDEKLGEVMGMIDRLIVSLEGGRDWTERIRGKGVYDKVTRVVDVLKDKGHDVVVRMGYFEDNMFSVLGEIDRFNSADVPVILFPRIDKPPMDVNTVNYFYNAISSFRMADILLPSYKNFVGTNPKGVTCPAGWAKVCVMPDGYLTPCQWNYEVIAHIDWRDEDIEYAFTRWCDRAYRIRNECLGCKYAYKCRGSCRASRDYLTCPVRYGATLSEVTIDVLGEVRTIDSRKIAELRRRDEITVHGCSAGC